jgi:hypothetical protein
MKNNHENIIVGELYYDEAFPVRALVLCLSKRLDPDNLNFIYKFYNIKTKITYTITCSTKYCGSEFIPIDNHISSLIT